MARKRNKPTVLPLTLEPDLYSRAKNAAQWEKSRLRIKTFGVATLARQGLETRVEEIEAERQRVEAA